MLTIRQHIKWNRKECGSKRMFFEVVGEPQRVIEGINYTLSPFYKPAPKSRLRNKNVFRKSKFRIKY
jgi:hypothetical protein